MALIETFAGQAPKDYSGPMPELEQFEEGLAHHQKLLEVVSLEHITAMAGISFGGLLTLVAAGVITREEGEYIVRRRREIVEETEQEKEARGLPRTGMAIIVRDRTLIDGLVKGEGPQYAYLSNELGRRPKIYHTNDYGEELGVIAAEKDSLGLLEQTVGSRKVRVLGQIHAAYHFEGRKEDSEKLARDLDGKVDFRDARVPVVTSTAPRVTRDGGVLRGEVVNSLWRKVDGPGMVKAIAGLDAEGRGVDVLDCGPGLANARLIPRLHPEFRLFSLEGTLNSLKGSWEEKRDAVRNAINQFILHIALPEPGLR